MVRLAQPQDGTQLMPQLLQPLGVIRVLHVSDSTWDSQRLDGFEST